MLYEHNSSIEPTSSTLLLQRTPSESGSYTTDEYSYRRNASNKQQQLKNQTIERNKKAAAYNNSNYNGGTLCSKSSTTSSHISEHSKMSANKSNMFLLNEMTSQELAREQAGQDNSPPSPAPQFTQNSSQRIFTTTVSQPTNYNAYGESAHPTNYDSGLYGGINRVQLGNRQHQTLNTRQLANQQQRNKPTRPVHNRVLNFIELNSEISGSNSGSNIGPNGHSNNHTMNLISNPLQGSLPSLVSGPPENKNNGRKMSTNRPSGRLQMNAQLNRSSSSLVSESDNLYCDIEEAQRVQSDFRAKLNKSKRYPDSGDENAEDLASENDRLIGNENKLIVRNRRPQDDEDDEDEPLTDHYSDYEYIDRLQTTANRQPPTNSYLTRYGQKPSMISGLNESKSRQLNLSLARNHHALQSTNSQPGLFRYKPAASFNTMQPNNSRM